MARDNFLKAIVDKLKRRVALKCSICHAPTSAPGEGIDGENNIGVAAHIAAAAEGGPRYDPTMTTQQRISIENAIWLCASCSRKIDNDSATYTMEALHELKRRAEERASHELGKIPPSQDDAIATLTTAFTGHQSKYLPMAISNVHSASSNVLESIDPRFRITTAFDSGVTKIGVHARETVPLSLRVSGSEAGGFPEKYRQLVEEGRDLELNAEDIEMLGSDLFQVVSPQTKGGKLVISSTRHDAIQRIWVVDPCTNVPYTFDDVRGYVTLGTKLLNFKGTACDGLFLFEYSCRIFGTSNSFDFSMSIDWSKWDGIGIRGLPYFERLDSLFSKISDGWIFHTSLEIRGLPLIGASQTNSDINEDLDYISGILAYVARSRIICTQLNRDIAFDANHSFTREEHLDIANAAEVFEGNPVGIENTRIIRATAKMIADSDCRNVKAILENASPIALNYIEQEVRTVNIFGTLVELPNKTISLSSVLFTIDGDVSDVREGDEFDVVVEPQADCISSVTYN